MLNKTSRNTNEDHASAEIPWAKGTRAVVSVLILLHLAAIFAAPLSAPPPSSMMGQQAGATFEPYLRALCLYNGYRFFAPNPGPSHLVRYEIESKSGETINGTFPDRKKHWPRLLYHRYLMLAETLYNLSSLPPSETFRIQQFELEVEISRLREEKHFELAQRMQEIKDRELFQYNNQLKRRKETIKAIVDELSRRHEADSIRLYLVEHEVPSAREIEETIASRLNRSEDPATRELPILTVNQSLFVELLVYPFDEAKEATPIRRSNPTQNVSRSPDFEEVSAL